MDHHVLPEQLFLRVRSSLHVGLGGNGLVTRPYSGGNTPDSGVFSSDEETLHSNNTNPTISPEN